MPLRSGPHTAQRRRRVDRPHGTLDAFWHLESLANRYPYVSAMLAELPRKRAGSAPDVARMPHRCAAGQVARAAR